MNTDRTINVPFTHRFRTTRSVFSPDNQTLEGLLTGAPRALFVIDDGVAEAWPELGREIAGFVERAGLPVPRAPLVVPGGEVIKNDRTHLDAVLAEIERAQLCRRSCLVVIGGGAVLDTAGFAAAIAHRGVRLVRLPTTTLAQCDSGVGVKNGVNAFGKKNFLGAFTPPWAVINDADFLTTLTDRDWRSGFSEAVKVALIKDAALFEEIEQRADDIAARNLEPSLDILNRSAKLHLDHITEGGDPFETELARPLDFGHWAAHRLESMTGYEIRHGEAVAIGLALDITYSRLAGHLHARDCERCLACLESLGFTLIHPAMQDPALLSGLEEFREHLGGEFTITLLNRIGEGFDAHQMDPNLIARAVGELFVRTQARYTDQTRIAPQRKESA